MSDTIIRKETVVKEQTIRYNVKDKSIIEMLSENFGKADREQFLVIHLTNTNKIKAVEIVAVGTLSQVAIHPREIFKSAILKKTHKIIVAHNHPSGDPTPSQNDLDTTRRLLAVSDILNIQIVDHIVFTSDSSVYTSIRKESSLF